MGGSWVTPASAQNPPQPNPFKQILTKLEEILAAIAATGGGGGDGNHTLRWDQALPAATRFLVLSNFASAAVLDRETGLVWERTPAAIPLDWARARYHCADSTTGNRKGWRLPSVHELASLVDPSVVASFPTLPAGHPFTNILPTYWSATTAADFPSGAWFVVFGDGDVGSSIGLKTLNFRA